MILRSRNIAIVMKRVIRWAIGITVGLLILVGIHYVVDYLCDCGRITLWDWLKLVATPVVLTIGGAVGGYLYNSALNARQHRNQKQQEHAAALRTYLEQMGKLLLEGHLYNPDSTGKPARLLARAWTVTVLETLGSERKRSLLRFLNESHLIERKKPVIELKRARFEDAFLEGSELENVNLSGAWFVGANLKKANLSGADFSGADLSHADLSGALLINADLSEADLRGADLSEADLRGADLSEANLRDTRGVTNESLEKHAQSLKGATMPDGSEHD